MTLTYFVSLASHHGRLYQCITWLTRAFKLKHGLLASGLPEFYEGGQIDARSGWIHKRSVGPEVSDSLTNHNLRTSKDVGQP
jgi:hypothetical protein